MKAARKGRGSTVWEGEKTYPQNINVPDTPGFQDTMLGRHIGHYRLTRRIGEGGMGEVYLAEREDEFRQRVAIKLIRQGVTNPEVIRRFPHRTADAGGAEPSAHRIAIAKTKSSTSRLGCGCCWKSASRCIMRTRTWWCIAI